MTWTMNCDYRVQNFNAPNPWNPASVQHGNHRFQHPGNQPLEFPPVEIIKLDDRAAFCRAECWRT